MRKLKRAGVLIFSLFLAVSVFISVQPPARGLHYSGSIVQEIEAPGMGDVIVDDFNSDGLDDLAVIGHAANTISIYHQAEGSHSLPMFPDVTIQTIRPSKICSGDVTDDGRTDLIILGENYIAIYEQQISDSFELFATLPVNNPRDIAVGDSGMDGLNDIFVTGLTGTTIFFQTPPLGFDPLFSISMIDAAGDALSLAMIDDDDFVDFAVATPHQISSFIQQSPDAYPVNSIIDLDETGFNPGYMSMGDVNSDNRVDIVTVRPEYDNGQPGTMRIFFSDSSYEFNSYDVVDIQGDFSTFTLMDVESDGTSEILVSLTDGSLSFVSRTSGFSLQAQPYATIASPEGVKLLASGHFGGDSQEDVVVRVPGFVHIIWTEDFPVKLVSPIPSTYHLNEGETRDNLIDLSQYFYDDHGILDYRLILEEDPSNLDATLSGHLLSFEAKSGWSGSLRFQVEAWDGNPNNNPTKSNVFSVWVNDAPRIVSVAPSEAEIDREYSYQIIVEDSYPQWDSITYKLVIGSDGMSINEDGLLAWTPTDSGTMTVRIEARDMFGLTDVQDFVVKVPALPSPPPVVPDETPYVAGAAVMVISAVAVAALISENVKLALFLLIVPLYTKIRRERVLDHFIRGQIYGYILANPGEHYNAIKLALGLTNGSLAHHLRTLEREEFVKSRKFGLYRRFYPKHMRIPDDGDFRLNNVQKNIVDVIDENPGISQKEIATAMNVTPPTVNYHIGILASAKMIRVVREGRRTNCFVERR